MTQLIINCQQRLTMTTTATKTKQTNKQNKTKNKQTNKQKSLETRAVCLYLQPTQWEAKHVCSYDSHFYFARRRFKQHSLGNTDPKDLAVFNPFTSTAFKNSGLKDARRRLQTV